MEEVFDFGGGRGPRDVFEELVCDWPMLAPDDVRTLSDALPPHTVCDLYGC